MQQFYKRRFEQFLVDNRLPYVSPKHMAFRLGQTEDQVLRSIDTWIDVDPQKLIAFIRTNFG